MKRYFISAIILFLFMSCLPALAQQNSKTTNYTNNEKEGEIFYHTIESGETVYAIATMYGVTTEDIYRLNPDSRYGIKTGSKLKIPQQKSNAKSHYLFHTIQAGETLYSLTIRYHIPASKIIEANPGLSVASFNSGKILRIPASEIGSTQQAKANVVTKKVTSTKSYMVKKKETLFSIAKQFNTTTGEIIRLNPSLSNGVKSGMTIQVPIIETKQVEEKPQEPLERDVNSLLSQPRTSRKADTINMALLLPFSSGNESTLFTEYYEGMLLAIDSLQKFGYNVNLSVYDTGSGTTHIKSILAKSGMEEMNLIIGGIQSDQIKVIADFAKQHDINYVIPFTSKDDEVLSNNCVFQINTPQSYLYANAIKGFCSIFGNDNVIFVNTGSNPKTEFIKSLKSGMQQHKMSSKELSYNSTSFTADIEKLLDRNKRNVIVPTSSALTTINKLKSGLRILSDVNIEGKVPYEITMFGYPEWQTYTKDCLDDFYALNVYIYSGFFANNLSPQVKGFYSLFKKWYSKLPSNTFPKYGILGFDTGMYFLQLIHKYGDDFENDVENFHYDDVQTGFNFHRVNNWGGFINTNIYIVHYKNNFTVTRTQIK